MASRIEQKQRARAQRLAREEAERREARRRASLMRLGLLLALAAVLVVVAVVVSSCGGSRTPGGGSSTGADAAAAAQLFDGIPQHGVTLGGAAGKPTLIELADLQCPYCAEYSGRALPAVVRDYVRRGKLRYELRVRPFLGPDSARAAGAAAEAARENRLYQFADVFYQRQQAENTGYVTDEFIRNVARSAGVDPAKAVSAAANAQGQPLVQEAERLAASLGSNTTPAFFLRVKGGRLVPVASALTAGAATRAIDQALAQA